MNIIITGATKGIGLAIAEKFAAEGFNLALNARNADDLKAIKKTFAGSEPISFANAIARPGSA